VFIRDSPYNPIQAFEGLNSDGGSSVSFCSGWLLQDCREEKPESRPGFSVTFIRLAEYDLFCIFFSQMNDKFDPVLK
jgi:hypothetical protein